MNGGHFVKHDDDDAYVCTEASRRRRMCHLHARVCNGHDASRCARATVGDVVVSPVLVRWWCCG